MQRGAPAPIRSEAEVLANRAEGGTNHRLRLRVPGWPGAEPGQFAMLSPGELPAAPRSDPLLPRPMAVYRGVGEEVEILYKRTGRGTRLLAAAPVGSRLLLVGPLGRGFAPPASGARALLVAGGTGIASVYELARRLGAAHEVSVLLGARSADDLMGEADFAALGAPLEVATEDGSRGARGRVTELLERALGSDGSAHVYACGPTPMMRRCAEIAAEAGAACSVALENHMACGFGVCLGCAAPLRAADRSYALVCRDGPVFDAERIAWDRMP